MIEVTRLNGLPVTVNADLIKFVEATPDTLISLTTGEKLMVKEPVELVARRVLRYRRRCCRGATTSREQSRIHHVPQAGISN